MIRVVLLWLAISTSLLSTVIVLFVAGQKGLMPQLVPSSLLQASGAAFDPAANLIRFYGLSTLAAAGPLWAASLVLPADTLMPRLSLRVSAASTSIAAALVAGRRAIVVVIVIAPLLAWMSAAVIRWKWGPKVMAGQMNWAVGVAFRGRFRMAAALGTTLVVLAAVYIAAPSLVPLSEISRAFNSAAMLFGGGTGVADVRVAEAKALIGGWLRSPVLGNGFGAVLPSFVRDPQKPWSFELQYHLILFQTGLTGALLGILALLATVRQLRRAARAMPANSATLVVTATGAVSLLLANAVDPYLEAPGHMWAIYLPLAVANGLLVAHMNSDRGDTPVLKSGRLADTAGVAGAAPTS